MATPLENAIAWRDDVLLRLANASSASVAGGKPNTGIEGSTDHMGYRAQLASELDRAEAQIEHLRNTDPESGGGPWEVQEILI